MRLDRLAMVECPDSRCFSRRARRLCWVVIVLSIAALTVTLATRTSVVTLSHSFSVDSQLSNSSGQHLDSDAVGWAPPVATLVMAEDVSFYPLVSPAGPPVSGLLFDKALYNRPPPFC